MMLMSEYCAPENQGNVEETSGGKLVPQDSVMSINVCDRVL